MNTSQKNILLSAALTILASITCNTYAMTQQEVNDILWQACLDKDIVMAEEALDNGADIEYTQDDEITPLINAIKAPPSPELVIILIEHEANIRDTNAIAIALRNMHNHPAYAAKYEEIIDILDKENTARDVCNFPLGILLLFLAAQ